MSKLWGGRFSEENISPEVLKFTSGLCVDKELAEYDCLSSIVQVEMLTKCGYICSEEKTKLVNVLNELLVEIKENRLKLAECEDIHSLVQDYVEECLPLLSAKLHTGRSRNEQVVNDVRLYCKDKISCIVSLISDLQKKLVLKAETMLDVIIPGYTHLNRAQPVLFSHLLMGYVEMLERDAERLKDAFSRLDVSVMGSGALAGSALEVDRKFVAKKMGFGKISANSIDAVSDRDFIVEFVSGLSLVAVHLSRMSEDFILYTTREFGFLEIGDEYCTGSSLMPQKKNPDVLELIRGKSSLVIAALNGLFVLLKGLPHSYNRDLQEDKKPLFESVKTVSAELEIFSGIVDSIEVKKETALKMLEDEFIYATDIAEYLVNKRVSFKDAHRVVGEIVKHCADAGINISDLSITDLKKFSEKFDENVYSLLNAEVSVEKKKTPGSTNPSFVKKEIMRWKKKFKK